MCIVSAVGARNQLKGKVMLTIEQRVQNGIYWLDTIGPKDWVDKIELLELEMGSTCNCVVGQVFNGISRFSHEDTYAAALRATGLTYLSGVECGFDVISGNDTESEYSQLHAEWTKRIGELKDARQTVEILETTVASSVCDSSRQYAHDAVLLRS